MRGEFTGDAVAWVARMVSRYYSVGEEAWIVRPQQMQGAGRWEPIEQWE
jgi:hypothetical protein